MQTRGSHPRCTFHHQRNLQQPGLRPRHVAPPAAVRSFSPRFWLSLSVHYLVSHLFAAAYTASSACTKTSSNTCPLPKDVSANYICKEWWYEGLFAYSIWEHVRTRR